MFNIFFVLSIVLVCHANEHAFIAHHQLRPFFMLDAFLAQDWSSKGGSKWLKPGPSCCVPCDLAFHSNLQHLKRSDARRAPRRDCLTTPPNFA
jgi:hypothetical protein